MIRKEKSDDCMVAMEWKAEGKRRVGRPKTRWRRKAEKEYRREKWASLADVSGTVQEKAG